MSVNGDEQFAVEALEAGADDFVTMSSMRELTARVRAALRRSRAAAERTHERIVIGDIEISPARRLVLKANKPVHLTPKEFELLHYLMAHAGLSMTHARLLFAVWGSDSANQVEYLRTYMRQLRRKLEDDPAKPRYLLTDNHIGYRFRELRLTRPFRGGAILEEFRERLSKFGLEFKFGKDQADRVRVELFCSIFLIAWPCATPLHAGAIVLMSWRPDAKTGVH